MSKKLFLASSFKDVAGILEKVESDLKGKTVTFIPTASKVEKVTFYVSSGKKALEKLGLIVDELDVATATLEEIRLKLQNNDFIYVTGGNSFYLLHELKKSGADKIIIDEVNKGKLYIGESAGAIITSPNIQYIEKMDSVKKALDLSNYNALDLVDFHTVPHHTNAPFKKILENIIADYSGKLNLKPISNKQAIVVSGNDVEVQVND